MKRKHNLEQEMGSRHGQISIGNTDCDKITCSFPLIIPFGEVLMCQSLLDTGGVTLSKTDRELSSDVSLWKEIVHEAATELCIMLGVMVKEKQEAEEGVGWAG